MQLFVLVLNHTEKCEDLMSEFSHVGIKGATIIESTGMARALYHSDDAFLGSLRALLNPDREQNKTIFTVLSDEQVEIARQAVIKVVGDLSKPDTGIIFTIPVNFVEGIEI